MERLTPLFTGVLAVLLAGCATATVDQPTYPASSPSQAPTAAGGVAPSPPTDITAIDNSAGQLGAMFTVRLTWTPATTTDAYRIYNYRTGEGPGFGKCVFDKAMAELLAETQPGATGADVSLNEAETGSGVRCIYVVAVNDVGESAPTLAWRSSE